MSPMCTSKATHSLNFVFNFADSLILDQQIFQINRINIVTAESVKNQFEV